MLGIKVENPCRPQQPPKPGKIHGHGLKNVKRCVDKYNGELQAVVQDGVFRLFVLLNMKKLNGCSNIVCTPFFKLNFYPQSLLLT